MGLKPMEILLIMGALLLLFGGSRLPQLGSSLGSAIRNFKRGFSGEESAPEEKKSPAAFAEGGNGVDMKDTSARSTTRQG
jgi:sec-independent protein translocase protein TatA